MIECKYLRFLYFIRELKWKKTAWCNILIRVATENNGEEMID